MLLRVAEELADTEGGEKILVTSGVGVREYYYRHGYSKDGPYVSKLLG
jgi:elongator complex protein 3